VKWEVTVSRDGCVVARTRVEAPVKGIANGYAQDWKRKHGYLGRTKVTAVYLQEGGTR
jgi:hypothetical protein